MKSSDEYDRRIPLLLDTIDTGDVNKDLNIAKQILWSLDSISTVVLEVTNDPLTGDDAERVTTYLATLITARNILFLNRDIINIAFGFDYTIDQHEDSVEFGEYGYIMNIINETSNLIESYRDLLKRI